jgi:hypothetical protein
LRFPTSAGHQPRSPGASRLAQRATLAMRMASTAFPGAGRTPEVVTGRNRDVCRTLRRCGDRYHGDVCCRSGKRCPSFARLIHLPRSEVSACRAIQGCVRSSREIRGCTAERVRESARTAGEERPDPQGGVIEGCNFFTRVFSVGAGCRRELRGDALTSQALKPLMVLHRCGLTRFKLIAARITAPNSERPAVRSCKVFATHHAGRRDAYELAGRVHST